MVKEMMNNNIKITKQEQKLEKINNNEWLVINHYEAKMTNEDKKEIIERLKKDINKCETELEKMNDEYYKKAKKEMEEKSEEQLKEYKKILKNVDTEIVRETEEEFKKRKQETIKQLKIMIENYDKAKTLAQKKLKQTYETEKNKYETQLKQQKEVLRLYEKED